jgi:hypothetical protein
MFLQDMAGIAVLFGRRAETRGYRRTSLQDMAGIDVVFGRRAESLL